MKILIVLIVLIVALSACLVTYYFQTDELDVISYSNYEGRVYLEEEDYSEFKKLLASREDLDILKLDVLSSPDALIDFRFRIEGDREFPYGEREIHYKDNRETAIFEAVVVGLVLVLSGLFMVSVFEEAP